MPIDFRASATCRGSATGSVNSQVPFAWQVYFCTPVAWTARKSLLSGAYVRGSSGSPGAVCGAGRANAVAATKPHRARTPAPVAMKRARRDRRPVPPRWDRLGCPRRCPPSWASDRRPFGRCPAETGSRPPVDVVGETVWPRRLGFIGVATCLVARVYLCDGRPCVADTSLPPLDHAVPGRFGDHEGFRAARQVTGTLDRVANVLSLGAGSASLRGDDPACWPCSAARLRRIERPPAPRRRHRRLEQRRLGSEFEPSATATRSRPCPRTCACTRTLPRRSSGPYAQASLPVRRKEEDGEAGRRAGERRSRGNSAVVSRSDVSRGRDGGRAGAGSAGPGRRRCHGRSRSRSALTSSSVPARDGAVARRARARPPRRTGAAGRP